MRSPMSSRGGALSTPASSSNTHHQPHSQNSHTSTSHTAGGPATQGVGESRSPFDLESLCATLPHIHARVQQVEQKVSVHEHTLGGVQFRLDNVENEIKMVKGKLAEFDSRISGCSDGLDMVQIDLDASRERVKQVQTSISSLNVTNEDLLGLVDSLRKSMKDISDKNKAQDDACKDLKEHAMKVKAVLLDRLGALDDKLQAHVEEDCQKLVELERTLADIKKTIDSCDDFIDISLPGRPNASATKHGEHFSCLSGQL